MCNCGDLKYAQKNHTHNYATQAAVDAAIAASGHVGQAEVDAAIAASGHVGQAEVDAAVANLQAQIDTLEQAMIDCGCGPCVDFAEEFTTGTGGAMLNSADWIPANNNSGQLRIKRTTSGDTIVDCSIPVETSLDGHVIEWSFKDDDNIDGTDVLLIFSDGSNEWLDGSTGGGWYTASATSSNSGKLVQSVMFRVTTLDETSFSRWLLDYVRLICP